jgi:hypothetical protein
MKKHIERSVLQRTRAELRARLVGNALEQHEDEIRFWQHASEKLRGQTLYEILARGERIRASIPHTRQEPNRLILRPGRIEIQAIA